jgi:hypothetical protein
MKTDFKRAVV